MYIINEMRRKIISTENTISLLAHTDIGMRLASCLRNSSSGG